MKIKSRMHVNVSNPFESQFIITPFEAHLSIRDQIQVQGSNSVCNKLKSPSTTIQPHTVNLITIYCCLHIRSINFYILLNSHIFQVMGFGCLLFQHILSQKIASEASMLLRNNPPIHHIQPTNDMEHKVRNLFSILTQKLDQFQTYVPAGWRKGFLRPVTTDGCCF